MSTRLRDENTLHIPHARNPTTNKKVINENSLKSIQRPTVASSLKVSTKPELKAKGSRPVLASLNEPTDPNATPRPKSHPPLGEKGTVKGKGTGIVKPKPLASKSTTIQTQSNTSSFHTPRPIKRVLPKSTKKAINVYTPARPSVSTNKSLNRGEEVEHTHPKPAGLEDDPPTPIRNAMTSTEDLGPGVDNDIFPEEPVGLGDITELPSGNLEEP